MTTLELQRLKQEIIATSAYYQFELKPQVITMYANDLEDLPLERVLSGYKKWRLNPKNTRHPLPAQIRALFGETVTDEDKARDATARIVSAISQFGYTNPQGAKDYIGALGWKVIERQGGWSVICERTKNDELPTYQAQWMRYAISIIHLVESGQMDEGPLLPSRSLESQIIMRLKEREQTKDNPDDNSPGAA